MEISTLSDKQFMVVIIKMLTKLRRRMDKQNFNKELENTKENQTELKNTVTGIKNALQRINSRLDDREEESGKLEGKQWKSLKLNRKKNKKETRTV